MTYQVLARKWRPRSFKEMAGQAHVLKTLIHSLDNNRLHHAYLFTGTRGVGKTTIARILAKCLNCEQGVTSEPCGQCSACREIDEGRFIDLIEVDAASRTKVEDTREMLDNVQYSPARGRFKVYLVDEVHMLSGHSFNALLKTLEEPPPHVKFLLATTDPQKLPVTVLSRCLQFNLKNLSPQQIVEHLQIILTQESIPFEENALWQLARAANGSVRDALTLLDQAIAYSEGNIRDSQMRSLLGTIDQSIIQRLVDALIARNAAELLSIVSASAEHAPDFNAVLEDLLSYLHRVAIAQVVPDGIDNSQGDQESILHHARSMPAENLQLYYQIALKGREEMPLSVDGRSGLEMTLLRMLAFTPDGVPNSPTVPLVEENTSDQSDADKQQKEVQKKKSPEGNVKDTEEAVSDLSNAQEKPAPQEQKRVRVTSSGQPPQKQPESAATPIIEAEQAGTPDNSGIPLDSLAPENWIQTFFSLQLSGITRSIAANCVLKSRQDEKIDLMLDQSQANVYNDEHRLRIERALSEYFDRNITLAVELSEINIETPAAWRLRQEQEKLADAIDMFENDANVREILERFSGSIKTDSIEPIAKDNAE